MWSFLAFAVYCAFVAASSAIVRTRFGALVCALIGAVGLLLMGGFALAFSHLNQIDRAGADLMAQAVLLYTALAQVIPATNLLIAAWLQFRPRKNIVPPKTALKTPLDIAGYAVRMGLWVVWFAATYIPLVLGVFLGVYVLALMEWRIPMWLMTGSP